MIKVCKRCGCDMELPDKSIKKYCQKGSSCFSSRMSENTLRCQKKKALAAIHGMAPVPVSDLTVLDKGIDKNLNEI
jgi:hypothetical protein